MVIRVHDPKHDTSGLARSAVGQANPWLFRKDNPMKNIAKWQSVDNPNWSTRKHYQEIKQHLAHYYIAHDDINDRHTEFEVSLFMIIQDGHTRKGSIKIETCDKAFHISKPMKLAAIKEMKRIGKSLFNETFDYFYGSLD